jgi:putative endonuclease
MPGRIMSALITTLDKFQPPDARAKSYLTGIAGEDAAYWHLRSQGYVMVARNWRSPRRKGEIDLVGWEGATLCFIEVKTRTSRKFLPAEAAVDFEKRRDLRSIANEYRRHLKNEAEVRCRFDVISVYLVPDEQPEITLLRDAFSLME